MFSSKIHEPIEKFRNIFKFIMLRLHDPYNSHDDELVNEYMMKDGGPIPILEMTYINKTQPKPCDKEVYLYELQETVLEKMGRPLQGILRNCHDSKCER